MSKKGVYHKHTNFILDLYSEGFQVWQICLWDKAWSRRFVKDLLVSIRRKEPVDPRCVVKPNPQLGLSRERFMQHHPRLFVGIGYKCLRCKATCDAKEEFEAFTCTATEADFPKRGPKKREYDPMKRLKHGRKYYKNG